MRYAGRYACEDSGEPATRLSFQTGIVPAFTCVFADPRPGAKLLANFSENGKTPLLNVKEVGALGYTIALYPSSLLFAAVKSAQEIAALLKGEGTSASAVSRMVGFDDLNDGILGKAAWQAEEERITALG